MSIALRHLQNAKADAENRIKYMNEDLLTLLRRVLELRSEIVVASRDRVDCAAAIVAVMQLPRKVTTSKPRR